MAEDEHDCVTNKCKGEKTNGMNVICSECKKKWFIECLTKEDDIFELMLATKILKENKDAKHEYNVSSQTMKTFYRVIGTNTSINFKCKAFRNNNDKEKMRVRKIEKENIDLKKEIAKKNKWKMN